MSNKDKLLDYLRSVYPHHEINYRSWMSALRYNVLVTVYNQHTKKLSKLVSNNSEVSEEDAIEYLLEQLSI